MNGEAGHVSETVGGGAASAVVRGESILMENNCQ